MVIVGSARIALIEQRHPIQSFKGDIHRYSNRGCPSYANDRDSAPITPRFAATQREALFHNPSKSHSPSSANKTPIPKKQVILPV
jgi:hypothetical protein